MKNRRMRLMAIFAASVLSVTSMGGIVTVHAGEALAVPADEAGVVLTDGKDVQAAEDGSVAASEGLIAESFKPSEIAQPAQDTYEYPFLGMKLGISKDLKEQMEKKNISMFTDERWDDNAEAVTYATASWCTLTDEQKDAEVDKMGTGYDDWLKSLSRVGVIGMYDEESQKDLDTITGCTEHKELGTSSDGKYKYYLSTNKDADADLLKDVEGIEVTLTEMTPFQMLSAFDQPQDTSDSTDAAEGTNVGKFETTGVDGKTYTQDIFSKYDLTMVNVFTTWCSPCINEIPDLEKLYQEMKDKGVGVVGVTRDTIGSGGKQDEEAVKKAQVIQEKTKASYPFLIPDSGMMNGRLNGISAFPETFFVDKNGNIVGETYSGSHSTKNGYLFVAIIYGCIFAACHFFCFAKTKEAVITPEKEKISVKIQLKAVMQNRPYLLALAGQILFGFTLYGRNADILYYFTYVEGNASYYTTYSMCIIIPSIIGAACFQPLFRKLNNKGRTASLFALFTGISMLSMFFFNAKESPAIFYALSGLTQFFFSGFNTAIYAIIPDCVEYGEWKTGLRNDGFQYAFISLGNKIGMAVGTALLAGLLGKYGYIANQTQNVTVLSIMKHAFTTIPGALWIVTAVVLFFYRLNKKRYNEIVEELKNGRKS